MEYNKRTRAIAFADNILETKWETSSEEENFMTAEMQKLIRSLQNTK